MLKEPIGRVAAAAYRLFDYAGTMVHYGIRISEPRTTDGSGSLKWQCSSDCHLFYYNYIIQCTSIFVNITLNIYMLRIKKTFCCEEVKLSYFSLYIFAR